MTVVQNNKQIIGANTYITVKGAHGDILAKVDTGADSSSIWASSAWVDDDNMLHFVLFDDHSPHHTGEEIVADEYKMARVTSSSGHSERRYKALLSILIEGRKVRTWFTLTAARADRSHPVLIGRRTLSGKFLVDVSLRADLRK